MSLFGEARDISAFRHINRELINDVIEQQVGYYKIVLAKTDSNMYGEASGTKTYNDPVLINCLIDRTDQVTNTDDFGPDVTRSDMRFRFFRDDLVEVYNIVPEVGDVVLWNEGYFEIDALVENQLVVGKTPDYAYSSDNENFGSSLSIIVTAHYMRPEKLGIKQERL